MRGTCSRLGFPSFLRCSCGGGLLTSLQELLTFVLLASCAKISIAKLMPMKE